LHLIDSQLSQSMADQQLIAVLERCKAPEILQNNPLAETLQQCALRELATNPVFFQLPLSPQFANRSLCRQPHHFLQTIRSPLRSCLANCRVGTVQSILSRCLLESANI